MLQGALTCKMLVCRAKSEGREVVRREGAGQSTKPHTWRKELSVILFGVGPIKGQISVIRAYPFTSLEQTRKKN